MKKITTVILLMMSFLTIAQDTFAVKNVRLFDGETVIENATIIVENGLISKVHAKKSKNKSVKTIDGTGKTLMPAMANAHVHAFMQGALREAAKAGVLNLLDMHGMEQFLPVLQKFNDSTDYANLYYAGSAATAPEGHGTQFGFPVPTLSKPEDAKTFVSDRVAAGFFVIPTLLTSIRALKQIRAVSPEGGFLSDDELKSEVKRLYDAGVPILAGTDPPNAQINYGDDLHKELKLIADSGIPNLDVLKGATSHIAKSFGLKNQGLIKKGYLANMILIHGNPLENIEDISNIEMVWKKGKKVKLD